MKEMRKKVGNISLKMRILIITSIILIVSIVGISRIFYTKTYNQTADLLKSQALSIAKSVVGGIDVEQFEQLVNHLDEENTYYPILLEQLKNINNDIGTGMLYTLIDIDETEYTYVADGSGTVEIGYKQQKEDFSIEAAMAFKDGKAYTSEPYYIKSFDKYYISAFVPIINDRQEVIGIVEYDYEGEELSSQLRSITKVILIVAIGLIILAIVINYLYLAIAFKPMNDLVDVMHHISNGVLNISIDKKRNDEIGKISEALNQTISNIRLMIEGIKDSSTHVTGTAQNIVASANQATLAYSDLAISATDISEMTQKHAIETSKIKEVLEKLDIEARDISNQINETSKIANQTYQDTEKGEKVIKVTHEQIESIEQSIINAQELISSFVNHMSKIQGIISTISGIADQTNLLALNASIEAARAGENGKGFAVVAGEVGKLAIESNSATDEITNIIEYINGQVNQVLEAINTSVGMTQQGKKYMGEAQNVFELIKNANQYLEKQMHEIENEVLGIKDNVVEINTNMDEIGKVSKVIDDNTMNLAAITEEQMATSQEFNGMAQILQKEAEVLNESISRFKTKNREE